MSRELETEVWGYSNAKAATRLVVLAIANEGSTETREAVVSIARLMRLTCLSQRSVYYNINKLEEMGEIEVLGDKHSPAAYRLNEYLRWDNYHNKHVRANTWPENYPQPGNIKAPERQRALQERRAENGVRTRRRKR